MSQEILPSKELRGPSMKVSLIDRNTGEIAKGLAIWGQQYDLRVRMLRQLEDYTGLHVLVSGTNNTTVTEALKPLELKNGFGDILFEICFNPDEDDYDRDRCIVPVSAEIIRNNFPIISYGFPVPVAHRK